MIMTDTLQSCPCGQHRLLAPFIYHERREDALHEYLCILAVLRVRYGHPGTIGVSLEDGTVIPLAMN